MHRRNKDLLHQDWGTRRVKGKRRKRAHDLNYTTLSVKPGGGGGGSVRVWACLAASGDGFLLFIDVAAGWVLKCIGLCYQFPSNGSKLTGQCFTVQMDINPKHTSKAAPPFFFFLRQCKMNINMRLSYWSLFSNSSMSQRVSFLLHHSDSPKINTKKYMNEQRIVMFNCLSLLYIMLWNISFFFFFFLKSFAL